jgi:hypothetical protein
MKEPTFAAAYAAFYPMLAELSRQNGYALAIHGSVVRDFDLVAIPWTKSATSMDTLITTIAKYAGMFSADKSKILLGPEEKEHGRKAWSILMGNGAVIDFSIMPMMHNAELTGRGPES